MSFTRRDFKMSAYAAERVQDLMRLQKHNLGVPDQAVSPFTLGWPNTDLPGASSRFRLPSLLFDRAEVARLGFRGTEGFIMVRNGLSEQVAHTVERRFSRVLSLAKNNHRVFQEEMRYIEEMFRGVFGGADSRVSHHKAGFGVLDSVNVLTHAFPDRAAVATFSPCGQRAQISLERPAYRISVPVFEIRAGQTGSEWSTGEFCVGRDLAAHLTRALPQMLSDAVQKEIRTAIAENRTAPDPKSVREAMNRRRWDGAADASGVFHLAKSGGAVVMMSGDVAVARLYENDGYLVAAETTHMLSTRQTVVSGLTNIANRIVLDTVPRRAVRGPDEEWVNRLETIVACEDLGYA